MPVIRLGKDPFPEWCEVGYAAFIPLKAGSPLSVERRGERQTFVVCRGQVEISAGAHVCRLPPGGSFDVGDPAAAVMLAGGGEALVLHAAGRWAALSGAGIFSAMTGSAPKNDTPYAYWKTTSHDNHYHDCDAYWFVWEGRARIAAEGDLFDVGPGDCVITRMGRHHDVVSCMYEETLRAARVEGELRGRKRGGHLWEPKHGPAEPGPISSR